MNQTQYWASRYVWKNTLTWVLEHVKDDLEVIRFDCLKLAHNTKPTDYAVEQTKIDLCCAFGVCNLGSFALGYAKVICWSFAFCLSEHRSINFDRSDVVHSCYYVYYSTAIIAPKFQCRRWPVGSKILPKRGSPSLTVSTCILVMTKGNMDSLTD